MDKLFFDFSIYSTAVFVLIVYYQLRIRDKKKLPVGMLGIVSLHVIGALIHVGAMVAAHVFKMNLPLLHVYTLVENFIIMSVFAKWQSNDRLKKFIPRYIIPGFVALWVTAKVTGLETFDKLDVVTCSLSNLLIIGSGFGALSGINEGNSNDPLEDPFFYIAVGIIVYQISVLLTVPFYYEVRGVWRIQMFINSLRHLTVIYAFNLLRKGHLHHGIRNS